MRRIFATLVLCFGLAAAGQAADRIVDYRGPFTTQVLYTMCSTNNPAARDKCHAYLQGLLYGVTTQRAMQERNAGVCLPDMTPEQARRQLLQFIDVTTHGKPSSNGDRGDWVAFIALAAGHLCKTEGAE